MRFEKTEDPWSDIRCKFHWHKAFDEWVERKINDPKAIKLFNKVCITKALAAHS